MGAAACVLALAAPGCGDTADGLTVRGEDPTNLPLAGLTDDEQARFDRGDVLFEQEFRPVQGLGPVYIRAACVRCHVDDARGPGAVERVVFVEADGFTPRADQSGFPFGPALRPQFVAPATQGVVSMLGPETPGVLRSVRVGPAVFGRGWMEAITDAAIEAGAAAQAQAGGVVRGRVARTSDGRIGRFGLKARVATLEDFSADAFRNDMGLTSPTQPTEPANPDGLTDDARPGLDLPQSAVDDVAFYVAALAIPRRTALSPTTAALFARVGCADCHTPALATGPRTRFAQMAATTAPVYSDMLLHDMGTALADGVPEGNAGPRDWRTAPLMGLRHFRSYLHDGRARTLDDAVTMHRGEGSEANPSVDAYLRLSATARAALLEFLGRL